MITMNENMTLLYVIGTTLCLSFVFFWVIFKIFRIRRAGVPHLVAIIISFLLAPFHPLGIITVAIPFAIGYICGRSTRVSINPFDTFSQRIKLRDEEYNLRAAQLIELEKGVEMERIFLTENIDWTDKMSLMFELMGFHLYKRAPIIALLTSSFYLFIWSLVNLEGQLLGELSLFLFMLSFPYGTTIGELVKYIKGHQPPALPKIMGQTFKPTMRSFIRSFIWTISPAVTALLLIYIRFRYEKTGLISILLGVLGGLSSLYLILQTIIVHLQKITLLDEGIFISGLGRPFGLRWSDIEKATLRERHNIISGTDRLLVLYSKNGLRWAYNTSTLSKRDEKILLSEVRKRIPTAAIFDRGYL